MSGPAGEIAARTPETRDRYVDFLRAASIASVVFGHWLIGLIFWDDGLIRSRSAIGVTTGLWLLTWVLQVMPLFFFVGGFSNYVTYGSFRSRGASTWAFLGTRFRRLLHPSLLFLGVWLVIQVFLHLADIGRPRGPIIWGDTHLLRGMSPPAATLPFGPLWFLAVYFAILLVSPVTIWLHKRYRWWIPAICVAGAVVVDLVGFGTGQRWVRFFNVPFVLLLPHQLGYFYADGTLARLPRRVFWAMAGGGLGLLVILTNPPLFELIGNKARFEWFPGIGHYPKSTLGTDTQAFSNSYPPTLCFLAVGIWTIGGAMLLRERMNRWLEGARAWKTVVYANSIVMTMYLWHMTAYLLAILMLWPLGFGHEHEGTARWWLERPLWIGVPAVILAGLVRIVGRFERPRSLTGAIRETG